MGVIVMLCGVLGHCFVKVLSKNQLNLHIHIHILGVKTLSNVRLLYCLDKQTGGHQAR